MDRLEELFQELYAAVVVNHESISHMYEQMGRMVVMQREDENGPYIKECQQILNTAIQDVELTRNALADARNNYERALLRSRGTHAQS